MVKTNAARLLDSMGINYELQSYDVDESDLSAVAVAQKLGMNVDQVFKTIILKGDKTGYFVCIVPGAEEVDLKKAARVSGNKSAVLIPMKDIFEITGYIRGGCSPVAMKRQFPTYIDETCTLFDYLFVSAGVRGLQFKIHFSELLKAVPCNISDLI